MSTVASLATPEERMRCATKARVTASPGRNSLSWRA